MTLKTTALHAEHVRLGARLVDFAGWDMPIQYQSQLDEHNAVRTGAGMFDVAHMAVVDVAGARARVFANADGQRCGQTHHARQGAVQLHAA